MPKRTELNANGEAQQFFNTPTQAEPKKKPGRKTTDPVKPRGIGLKASEWDYLQSRADEWGYTLHELCLYMMRHGIERFKRGEMPGVRTVQKLDPTK